MWCRAGVCTKLQAVFVEKHKLGEDDKVLQKLSHCSPSLLMFSAQPVPLAGI